MLNIRSPHNYNEIIEIVAPAIGSDTTITDVNEYPLWTPQTGDMLWNGERYYRVAEVVANPYYGYADSYACYCERWEWRIVNGEWRKVVVATAYYLPEAGLWL